MSSTPATGPTDVATEVAPPVTTTGEPHRHVHAERSRLPMWAAVALTVVSGALVAVQSRINGELARRLDDFAVASVVSFGSGLVILLLVTSAWPAGRRGVGRLLSALRDRRIGWWMLLGGLAGAWFVATQGIAAAVLGVALFTIAIVAERLAQARQMRASRIAALLDEWDAEDAEHPDDSPPLVIPPLSLREVTVE